MPRKKPEGPFRPSRLKRKYVRKKPIQKTVHIFEVPGDIYQKALADIATAKPKQFMQRKHYDEHPLVASQQNCFRDGRKNFSVCGKYGLNQMANFQRAAKLALEMRDFTALYRVVIKGYELNDKLLSKVLYEYLYIAIEQDPLIEETRREAMLLEAVRGCKDLFLDHGKPSVEFKNDKEALKHIKKCHLMDDRDANED